MTLADVRDVAIIAGIVVFVVESLILGALLVVVGLRLLVFIDVAQTHDCPPVTRLMDAEGKLVTELAHSDMTKFTTLGLKPAELIEFKAADGRTDLGRMGRCLPASVVIARLAHTPYSTLPIFFTAAIRRALSSATNLANSGASI